MLWTFTGRSVLVYSEHHTECMLGRSSLNHERSMHILNVQTLSEFDVSPERKPTSGSSDRPLVPWRAWQGKANGFPFRNVSAKLSEMGLYFIRSCVNNIRTGSSLMCLLEFEDREADGIAGSAGTERTYGFLYVADSTALPYRLMSAFGPSWES